VPFRFWNLRRAKSVHQDWRTELPSDKSQVYKYALDQAEPAHVIFSMTLDQAMTLHRSGKYELARDQAELSSELCLRFAAVLECLLTVMERHADHFGLLPSVKPLDPVFFVGTTAKRAAEVNSLLSNVLFGGRLRFLHKVRMLGEIAGDIAEEYRSVTLEVSQEIATNRDWDQLSLLQDDLTTSLSEAAVMLKSFIISLPAKEVFGFRDRLAAALLAMGAASEREPKPILQRSSQAVPALTDRRTASFRRE
jgi:hypothetical protein